MARIGTVLSFLRVLRGTAQVVDIKSDRGAGDNITAEHFGPLGDDSPPLRGDHNILIPTTGTGSEASVGYIDPKNEGTAAGGEKRIYSRKPDGTIAAEVWLKGDGSIALTNENGGITLNADGSVVINGATFDPMGNLSIDEIDAAMITADAIEAITSLVIANLEVLGHTHTVTAPGSPSGPMIGGPPA